MIKDTIRHIDNYLFSGALSGASTSTFWYLRERPNLRSRADLELYLSMRQSSPFYVMDYRKKTKYKTEDSRGIITLNYGSDIGSHINPEAAFQYALGLHDDYKLTTDESTLAKFLRYAEYFRENQTEGNWHYNFDYYEHKKPWGSALAQSRGISVMARAYLLTGDHRYKKSAIAAYETLELPIQSGGYKTTHRINNEPYYEEYPISHNGVINGHMAVLMGIWESWKLLEIPGSRQAFQTGIISLGRLLPLYSIKWWTLYDRAVPKPIIPNLNSHHYHAIEINYLRILTILSGDKILQRHLAQRKGNLNTIAVLAASAAKAIRKILVR